MRNNNYFVCDESVLLIFKSVNIHGTFRAAVILLMNGGAQVNIRDNQGCLPVHLAAWTGNVDICQSLLHLQAHTEINAQVGCPSLSYKTIS